MPARRSDTCTIFLLTGSSSTISTHGPSSAFAPASAAVSVSASASDTPLFVCVLASSAAPRSRNTAAPLPCPAVMRKDPRLLLNDDRLPCDARNELRSLIFCRRLGAEPAGDGLRQLGARVGIR